MKKINLFVAGLALAACSPMVYNLDVEMRQPSKSGMDLAGKTLAVVYDDAGADTAFCYGFAEGFATALENDYFGGERAIGIYSVDLGKADYSVRDSMVSLVMQTDADVVFLLENPKTGNLVRTAANTSAPLTIEIQAYDSMAGDKDKVRTFNGTTTIAAGGMLDEAGYRKALNEQAPALGTRASGSFVSTWKAEQFPIYYYDSAASWWLDATRDAVSFKWKDAIEKWIKVLDTKNSEKKACAEYNIAVGFFMLGDKDLALKWLDRADADCALSLSPGLRSKINAKK